MKPAVKLRHDARPTSIKAATLAYPKAGTQRAKVFDLLCSHDDGLTDAQIQDMLGIGESSQRPRRVELVEQGLIQDSGSERVYKGHGPSIVWVLTDRARQQQLPFGQTA